MTYRQPSRLHQATGDGDVKKLQYELEGISDVDVFGTVKQRISLIAMNTQ